MAIKLKITSGDYSAEIEAGKTVNLVTSLKYLANDVVFEAVDAATTLISFTVSGTTYQAVDGMTWQEWCDSEYNTGGFFAEFSSGTVLSADGYTVVNEAREDVAPNYLIRANATYYINQSGGTN